MPRRPCLGTPGHPCPTLALAPPGQSRCPACTRATDRARGSRQQRGYDTDYDRARRALHLEARPPCHWCGTPATTADHYPPVQAIGPHTNLVPACRTCNLGHVAAKRYAQANPRRSQSR